MKDWKIKIIEESFWVDMNELVVTLKALEIAHTDHNHCVPPVSALQKKHSRGISSASYDNPHPHALPKPRV